ncbi:dicarboxylate/amino acid:cation symporter [Microbulbifer thermotolerans]|uniref:Sodium:dicarboxylate symporter n=1 Tax=Microbulbifer thermotolerans TaxID=252514 RepID=A0A143HQX1_MICTH|nr:dicarboxylate/amino acid:cation symporter [Microbulbifer thermotolerans]AMX03881.1 sodium:dicarboxylate symporter [Microbulbifer thermotolerans]MCX2778603.1 dicarboxylate/amino acid:cation symporter [Microbulbifer thermotolerans]MCX2782851.1 dicarboxylate/amino acid:cation symporter [Microbulbifer thermotolerans]MCX2794079.1 dicarboxylate/amino acid:cation symporter [Microbulbifer thermotolerans]MCX2803888.1 dicarboxylate/amino acid:cation symporter [Microbulbifer thermotolerans]
MGLTARILIAMLAGIVVGVLFNFLNSSQLLGSGITGVINSYLTGGLFDVIGRIFIASLKLMVVPLVLVSLVCGACALSEGHRMGPLAGKTLLLYMLTTAVAITLALCMALIVQPGVGVDVAPPGGAFQPKESPPLSDVLVNIFPTNPVAAMAQGNMLQIIVFALLMGYAISRCGEPGQRVASFFNDLNEVILRMVGVLMVFAPYGVFALLAKTFAELGVEFIWELGKYFLVVLITLLLHAFGVYSLLLKCLSGLNPVQLFKKMRPAQVFAFSTASSAATIPVTLSTVEKRLGVDNKVAAFTVPLGATINMDGTAIMQGVATAFMAQMYGIEIGLAGYLTVILTATLASIGTAGVPGVGLVMLAMVLQQVGLPLEGIALVMGVDRLLDMVRTAVNITGDAVVSVIVAKSEGALSVETFNNRNYDSVANAATP